MNCATQREMLTFLKTQMSIQGIDTWDPCLTSFIVSHKDIFSVYSEWGKKVFL